MIGRLVDRCSEESLESMQWPRQSTNSAVWPNVMLEVKKCRVRVWSS